MYFGASRPSVSAMNAVLEPIVAMAAPPLPHDGVQHIDDPIDRQTYTREGWAEMIPGIDRVSAAIVELMTARNVARANVENRDHWHDDAKMFALDPPWMQGQKNIVAAYPSSLKDLSDSLSRTRGILQYWLADTVALSTFAPIWFGPSTTVAPMPGMLMEEALIRVWPGDPDAVHGRLPADLRGELFTRALRAAGRGEIDPQVPVPWWMMGFTYSEFINLLHNNPLGVPTYGDLLPFYTP